MMVNPHLQAKMDYSEILSQNKFLLTPLCQVFGHRDKRPTTCKAFLTNELTLMAPLDLSLPIQIPLTGGQELIFILQVRGNESPKFTGEGE